MRLEPIHQWAAGIEIRPNLFNEVGDDLPPHQHDHPHLTMVTRGRLEMRRGLSAESCAAAQPQIIGSAAMMGSALPTWVEIPAGVWHSFKVLALENGAASLMCLWPGGVK